MLNIPIKHRGDRFSAEEVNAVVNAINNLIAVNERNDASTPYLSITVDEGTEMLDYGDTVHVRCRVMLGWSDVTEQVAKWTVERETEVKNDDNAWNLAHAEFKGFLEINERTDLAVNAHTTIFRFTATLKDQSMAQAILQI